MYIGRENYLTNLLKVKDRKMIKSEDISVVVQGAIDKQVTKKCLQSIRKNLPQAEIILSTWENSDDSDIEGLFDCLVLSKDPGAYSNTQDGNRLYNINRYIVSTQAGISKASRNYILKIRSDIILSNNNFIQYFDKFNKRNLKYCLFNHKVIIPSLYSIKGELGMKKEFGKYHPTPYHISDWWAFGKKEDIEILFSCNFIKDLEKFSKYFINPNYNINWLKERTWRFPPEQYICVELAKRLFDLKFDNCLDYKNVDLKKSEKFIINNFIILDYEQSGLFLDKEFYRDFCKKYVAIPPHVFFTMYNFELYKFLYNHNVFSLLIYIYKSIRYFIKNRRLICP